MPRGERHHGRAATARLLGHGGVGSAAAIYQAFRGALEAKLEVLSRKPSPFSVGGSCGIVPNTEGSNSQGVGSAKSRSQNGPHDSASAVPSWKLTQEQASAQNFGAMHQWLVEFGQVLPKCVEQAFHVKVTSQSARSATPSSPRARGDSVASQHGIRRRCRHLW